MAEYDVVIVGSGPGGYVAAIRAGQLGMKAAVVERAEVGGVCLNWGCVPTKSLLRNAEVLGLVRRAAEFGISVDNLRFDFGKAIDRSREIVYWLTQSVSLLLAKHKVDVVQDTGVLRGPDRVEARGTGRVLTAKNVVVATGARPVHLAELPVDGRVVITSREAVQLREVPRRAVIVGAGPVGVEFAHLWRMYGAEVTLVELLPRLLPMEDEEISAVLLRAFEAQGIGSMTASRVAAIEVAGDGAVVTVSGASGESVLECDKVLVSVGMRGNADGIGLEEVGVATERGFISVDDRMETNVRGVYAVGDVTGKLLLAHVASAQGVTAVEAMAGLEPPRLDYEAMPRATYCKPQVASFGLTEAQALARGINVRIGKRPISASAKALALGEAEGMAKLVVGADVGDILGVHMIGAEVTELLGELGLARLLEGTTEELGWLVHPHPSISEVVKEAALAADGRAIHA